MHNEIVVREKDSHKELSRIPESYYIKFSKNISLPIDIEGDRRDGQIIFIAINRESNKLYVFVDIPEYRGATGNESWEIIESDIEGGELTALPRVTLGRTIVTGTFTFSPKAQFMSYLAHSRMGAVGCSYSRFIEVYDLKGKKAYVVEPPKEPKEYTESYNIPPVEEMIINSFIDSYKWVSDDSIEMTFYFTKCLESLTLPEIWQYNLTTGEYTFIETISLEK